MTEARTPLHTRNIRLDGYARPDGMLDIEARLTDVKHYDMPQWARGPLPAGEPMHHMVVTMTVDAGGTIRAFEARTLASPKEVCTVGAENFSRLVGLSIRKGFLKAAAERIGGVEGCTHIRELLQQMATVAFQSMRETRVKRYDDAPRDKPVVINVKGPSMLSSDAVEHLRVKIDGIPFPIPATITGAMFVALPDTFTSPPAPKAVPAPPPVPKAPAPKAKTTR
jgi:hypothetical protein